MIQVTVNEDEPLDKAIRRFKRFVEKEGVIREVKRRAYFVKPSTLKYRHAKALKRKLEKQKRDRLTQNHRSRFFRRPNRSNDR